MPATLVFVSLDVMSVLLSVILASTFGERYGDELSPNILIFVVSFFLVRNGLYWLWFRSIVNRNLDWTRSIFQSMFLIIFISILIFVIAALPTYYTSLNEKAEHIILFFTNVQGTIFYYVIVPTISLILSLILHKLYKLEPW